MKNILFTTFLFIFFLLSYHKVEASGLSLAVYPPVSYIHSHQDKTFNSPVTITNFSDAPVTLMIFFKSFNGNTDGTTSFNIDPLQDQAFGEYVSNHLSILDKENKQVDSITLAPQESKMLIIHGTPFKDYRVKDYYFSVFFVSSAFGGRFNGSLLSIGAASNILLSFSTPLKNDLQQVVINNFSTDVLHINKKNTFKVTLMNKSDHYLTTSGNITINNIFGQPIETVALFDADILSHSTRIMTAQDISSLNNAELKEISWPGLYSAVLSISLYGSKMVISKKVFFFVLPLQTIFIVVVLVSFLFLSVYRIKKRLG